MTIQDLITKLFKAEHIVEIHGDVNKSVDKGYDIKGRSIRTGKMIYAVEIHPNVDWTDGTCRPAYCHGYVNIYLNTEYPDVWKESKYYV